MIQRVWILLFSFMLISLFPVNYGSKLFAEADSSELTISLPGGGEIISSDELALGNPEDFDDADPEGFLINFNTLDIVEVIRFVSRISGKNFIFDEEELDFTVTIVSEEPTSVENVMAALLQVLKIHNLQLIEQGNNILIHKNPNVNRPSQIVGDEEQIMKVAGGSSETSLVTRVFRLERVSAKDLSLIIRSMTSADALVETLLETNHLVITDLSANVTRVANFIRSVDAPGGQLDIGQYVAKNTHMIALVDLARSILTPIAQNDPLQLIAHTPTESIFIISTPYMVERAMSILQVLDLTGDESRILSIKDMSYDPEWQAAADAEAERSRETVVDTRRWEDALPTDDIRNTKFEFYKLQYRTADTVQRALEQIGESISGTSSNLNTDLLEAIESIQAIEESNSLVFTGSGQAVEVIHEFIGKIDIPLRQVFIEMLLLDTTMDNALQFGVEWGGRYDGSPDSGATYGFLAPGSQIPSALDSITNGNANPGPLGNTEGFSVGALGKMLTHRGDAFTSMSGLVRAIQTDSDINLVMNPKILTEDNTPAEVFVGINTRFQTESLSNNTGEIVTTNFEFRDVGSLFRVTPLLGDSDMVTLIIEQELSQGLGESTAEAESQASEDLGPVTKQIRTLTRVHIPNKHFLVMSGMITEQRTKEKRAVPCMGSLPGLGAAFASNAFRTEKRNLMMFIRPQIIDSVDDIEKVTKDQRVMFENKSQPREKWKYEIDTGLDILNLKKADLLNKEWGP